VAERRVKKRKAERNADSDRAVSGDEAIVARIAEAKCHCASLDYEVAAVENSTHIVFYSALTNFSSDINWCCNRLSSGLDS
jgi:hypothetical protein